jgi:hypothetical protein
MYIKLQQNKDISYCYIPTTEHEKGLEAVKNVVNNSYEITILQNKPVGWVHNENELWLTYESTLA